MQTLKVHKGESWFRMESVMEEERQSDDLEKGIGKGPVVTVTAV